MTLRNACPWRIQFVCTAEQKEKNSHFFFVYAKRASKVKIAPNYFCSYFIFDKKNQIFCRSHFHDQNLLHEITKRLRMTILFFGPNPKWNYFPKIVDVSSCLRKVNPLKTTSKRNDDYYIWNKSWWQNITLKNKTIPN